MKKIQDGFLPLWILIALLVSVAAGGRFAYVSLHNGEPTSVQNFESPGMNPIVSLELQTPSPSPHITPVPTLEPILRSTIQPTSTPISMQTPAPSPSPDSNELAYNTEFTHPYLIMWHDSGVRFELTGVMLAPPPVKSQELQRYLTLKFKATNENVFSMECVTIKVKRVLNEEGDMVQPNSTRGQGCYFEPQTTHPDESLVFIVDPSEVEFLFTMGNITKPLFSVHLRSGNLQLEKLNHELHPS